MIDRFERFSLAISEISRCWHKIAAEEMEKHGLKGPHAVYLVTLSRHEDGLTAPRLCELCGKDKADVSRMMSIMEEKGLVVKSGNGHTLYRGVIKLTDEGKKAAHYVRERASLATALAGKELSEEKRAIFYDALESIANNLKEISKDGLPTKNLDE